MSPAREDLTFKEVEKYHKARGEIVVTSMFFEDILRGREFMVTGEELRGTRFYTNCKRQRKVGAKICQDCPLRKQVEIAEREIT